MTPVDTSAEAVERWIGCAEAFDARSDYGNGLLDRAAEMLRALAKERAEQEVLLAERNRANAAAFTASDAYQKRCEQGDALLREAKGHLFNNFTPSREKLLTAIDAHLAGEDMGRGI
jgi:hypothetical protein